MKFKRLLRKIQEQSGSGNAVSTLNRVENLKNYVRRPARTTPPYVGRSKV